MVLFDFFSIFFFHPTHTTQLIYEVTSIIHDWFYIIFQWELPITKKFDKKKKTKEWKPKKLFNKRKKIQNTRKTMKKKKQKCLKFNKESN